MANETDPRLGSFLVKFPSRNIYIRVHRQPINSRFMPGRIIAGHGLNRGDVKVYTGFAFVNLKGNSFSTWKSWRTVNSKQIAHTTEQREVIAALRCILNPQGKEHSFVERLGD